MNIKIKDNKEIVVNDYKIKFNVEGNIDYDANEETGEIYSLYITKNIDKIKVYNFIKKENILLSNEEKKQIQDLLDDIIEIDEYEEEIYVEEISGEIANKITEIISRKKLENNLENNNSIELN